MAEKCVICGEKIEKTFLEKINGTYIKGKSVCSNCQRKYRQDLEKQVPEK